MRRTAWPMRWVRTIPSLAGIAWLVVTFVGTASSSDPLWSFRLFRRAISGEGVTSLLLFLVPSLVLVPAGLWGLVRWLARRCSIAPLVGLWAGVVFSVYVDFLQFALPYIGDHANVPGLPVSLTLFGEDRLAIIWAAAFGVNAVLYATVGLLTGAVVSARRRRGDAEGATERDAVVSLRMMGGTLAAAALVCGLVLRSAGPGTAAVDAFLAPFGLVRGVRYEPGVTYGRAGDVDLKLDLCMPDEPNERRAAVVCIHGGGWHGGTRDFYTPLVVALARRGYVAVTITYRLAPEHRFPAQIEDVKRSVRWLRGNAGRLGFDPERIGVVGWSAGGYLACLLGTSDDAAFSGRADPFAAHSSRVQAVVSFSGLTDLTAEYWDRVPSGAQALIGASRREAPATYREASPISHVDGDDPPFMFLHGDADGSVPPGESQRMHRALESVGGRAVVRMFAGIGHRWHGAVARQAAEAAIAFLDEHLGAAGRTPALDLHGKRLRFGGAT